jgi:hypothetical protein
MPLLMSFSTRLVSYSNERSAKSAIVVPKVVEATVVALLCRGLEDDENH